MFDLSGLGPVVTRARIVFSRGPLTLKAYGTYRGNSPVVLIVPAPIKRSYIWDLLPQVSVIRQFLREQIQVYLIEWERPGTDDHVFGLDEYADLFISKCLASIKQETGRDTLFIAGHSLGGTLAAIFSCLHPEKVKGLILIGTPVSFGADAGDLERFVALTPSASVITHAGDNVPGSFLDVVSFAASPYTFAFLRSADWLGSFGDSEAMRIHLAIERWSLDETPLSRQLFAEVMEHLYRDNQFIKGALEVCGKTAFPESLTAPIISVLDSECTLVPPQSFLPFYDAVKSADKKVLWYGGDTGVALRHVGTLVGRNAHQGIWPEILRWVRQHSP